MTVDHYKILGVPKSATQSEIRSAYRRMVMQYHPDQNSDPKAAEQFLLITRAYDVIGDTDQRRTYDSILEMEADRARETKERAATPPPNQPFGQVKTTGYFRNSEPNWPPPSPSPQPRPANAQQNVSTIAAEITRLTLFFNRHQFLESEKLAREILVKDSRQPIPYAVLGDLHRSRGEYDQALKMYAYATQMDGQNATYQLRYEELLNLLGRTNGPAPRIAGYDQPTLTLAVGGLLLLIVAAYVVVAPEKAIIPGFALLSTWTLGLMVMLFMSGVIVGSVLSIGNFLDRFMSSTTSSTGKPSPLLALGSIAIVNFWAAAALFGVLGVVQKTFQLSATRLLAGVGGTTLLITGASMLAPNTGIHPGQVLLWGGNLVYIGSICGWMAADAFRR